MVLKRLEKVKDLMKSKGLDALLATSPENIYYVSEFEALEPAKTWCCVIITKENTVLLIPAPEEGFVPTTSPIKNIRLYGGFYIEGKTTSKSIDHSISSVKKFIDSIYEILKENEFEKGKLGVEEDYLPYSLYKTLQKMVPKAKFEDSSIIFKESRIIKTEDEIERIRKAVKASENALLKAYSTLREGDTELEFTTKLKKYILEEGAESIFVEMGAGARSGFPTHPSQNKIRKGDIVHVDLGVKRNGYCSDMSRSAVFKEPSERQKRIYKAVLAGQQEAVEIVKPGVKLSDIFKVAQEGVRREGYPQFWRHHVGHGIGLEAHEDPKYITSMNQTVLEPGMVICIEIPYYIANFGCLSVEDIVLVTEDGHKSISTMSRELYTLPLKSY